MRSISGARLMAALPAWMYRDPSEISERMSHLRDRMAKAEQDFEERQLRNKRRRIRKLVKLAKARSLKGQTNG